MVWQKDSLALWLNTAKYVWLSPRSIHLFLDNTMLENELFLICTENFPHLQQLATFLMRHGAQERLQVLQTIKSSPYREKTLVFGYCFTGTLGFRMIKHLWHALLYAVLQLCSTTHFSIYWVNISKQSQISKVFTVHSPSSTFLWIQLLGLSEELTVGSTLGITLPKPFFFPQLFSICNCLDIERAI